MLDIQLENGDRLWTSVYAIKTVKHGPRADTALITWTDGSHAIVKSEASALVRLIRIEMEKPGRV